MGRGVGLAGEGARYGAGGAGVLDPPCDRLTDCSADCRLNADTAAAAASGAGRCRVPIHLDSGGPEREECGSHIVRPGPRFSRGVNSLGTGPRIEPRYAQF
jgi:hypothetical protein